MNEWSFGHGEESASIIADARDCEGKSPRERLAAPLVYRAALLAFLREPRFKAPKGLKEQFA
jgi:hypothetical protein